MNLEELEEYTAGVYQIEDGDDATGGPEGTANQQAIALANRTKYLKAHVDAIEGDTTWAPIASPNFTGVPTVIGTPPASGTSTTQIATTAFVTAAIAAAIAAVTGIPAGTVAYHAGTSAPTGWVAANGQSLLRSVYVNLFAAIGTAFGSVDGTHFNVPDLRGEFIRGLDSGRGIDTGRTRGSVQKPTITVIDLSSDGIKNVHCITTATSSGPGLVAAGLDVVSSSDYSGASIASVGGTAGLGGPLPGVENARWTGGVRPRNVALMAVIKA